MPSLPDRHGHQTVRLPSGDKAVICKVPENLGTADEPEYRSVFYVHTEEDTERHALRDIRRLQTSLEPWTPRLETETEREAYERAAEGEVLWSDALQIIGQGTGRDRRTAEVVAHG